MAQYVSAGGRPDDFWHSTPKELHYFFKGAELRRKLQYRMNAFSDWHVAALGRTKKFPALDKYLKGVEEMVSGSKKTSRQYQTVAEMQEVFRSWHEKLKVQDAR